MNLFHQHTNPATGRRTDRRAPSHISQRLPPPSWPGLLGGVRLNRSQQIRPLLGQAGIHEPPHDPGRARTRGEVDAPPRLRHSNIRMGCVTLDCGHGPRCGGMESNGAVPVKPTHTMHIKLNRLNPLVPRGRQTGDGERGGAAEKGRRRGRAQGAGRTEVRGAVDGHAPQRAVARPPHAPGGKPRAPPRLLAGDWRLTERQQCKLGGCDQACGNSQKHSSLPSSQLTPLCRVTPQRWGAWRRRRPLATCPSCSRCSPSTRPSPSRCVSFPPTCQLHLSNARTRARSHALERRKIVPTEAPIRPYRRTRTRPWRRSCTPRGRRSTGTRTTSRRWPSRSRTSRPCAASAPCPRLSPTCRRTPSCGRSWPTKVR